MELLDRIFKIIDLLKNNEGMRLQDISNDLDLHKSTTHRLLSELITYGYVKRNNETKKYSLSLKFLEIASHLIEGNELIVNAKDSIEKLNTITKENIHLAELVGDSVIYIDKKESPHSIRMYSQVGKSVPLYCTGVGKVILAFQPLDIRDRLISRINFIKYTNNTIADVESLLIELDKIVKDGFALDNQEHENNIACIAAPIRDYNGNVIASISITAILFRMNFDKLLDFKDLLLEESNNVSKKMKYK